MKKPFFYIIFLFFWSINLFASEKKIHFIFTYPAGGGVDAQGSELLNLLSPEFFSFEKHYFKSCSDALRFASEKNNESNLVFILADIGDLIFSDPSLGSRCPPLQSLQDTLEPVTLLGSLPLFLCSSPNGRIRSVDDFFLLKKITVGYSSTKTITLWAKDIEKNNNNIIMVPYSGGAALKTALHSKEIDGFLGSNMVFEMMPQGSKCFMSTAENDLGLPHIKEILRTSFTNWETIVWIGQFGQSDDKVNEIIFKKSQSKSYTDWLSNRNLSNASLTLPNKESTKETIIIKEKQINFYSTP